ncbi:amino acid/polyamine/organocation transporter, APC superfamily [Duganella sp. CF458]|uniref:APC family permease n=1 Tax=Duganella sp. CF458 TaxID=1884368 RepID=UPI0008EA2E92|nr:amino acid permease [Duganella sp. CF458]SFG78245.1 amino acid/polyamine/organocation transporter, APC superfamily [Duganella sp. CF458]
MHATSKGKPLGFWMCTSLIVGNMIGMGIFMLPAALAPFGKNAFAGWAITVIGCLFIAHVFARLARAMPDEDGPYGYCRRAFGNGVAFFTMWCYWVSIWVTNAALAIGIVGYLTTLVPALSSHPALPPLTAMGIIWFFVLVSLRGALASGRVQLVSAALKLLPMGAIVLLGAWIFGSDSAAYTAHLPPTPFTLDGTAAAGTIALFAMLGVECASLPATKVDQPERTIPRATIAGTLVAAIVYVLVCTIPMLLLPPAQLAASNAPFVDLFRRYWDAGSGHWLAMAVIFSGLGALNGWTMLAGEVTASMARHGIFPATLKSANRHGAPAWSLLLVGMLASVMIAMNYSRSMAEAFTFLTLVVTAASMPLYLVGGAAVFKLRQRGAMLAFSAVMTCIFSLWAFYGMGKEAFWWGVALGAVSLPVFWLVRWRHKERLAEGSTPPATAPQ